MNSMRIGADQTGVIRACASSKDARRCCSTYGESHCLMKARVFHLMKLHISSSDVGSSGDVDVSMLSKGNQSNLTALPWWSAAPRFLEGGVEGI